MALDRSETAVALLVVVSLFLIMGGPAVHDDHLWIDLPVVLLFGVGVFVIGVEYGMHRERRA